MPMVQVKNYNFYYEVRGNSTQPPLLFLHGFLGDWADFELSISRLSEQFYCLGIDLPGHGKTQVLTDDTAYTMSETAAGIIEFIDILNIRPCFLVGYSMGGRLALYLTLHFPNYFSQVILESSSPGLKTEEERSQRLQADLTLAEQLETLNFSEFLENWYSQPLFQSFKTSPNFDKIITHRLQNNPKELAKSLRYMGTGNQPSLWEKLPQNQIPLLLTVGEWDNKFQRINQKMVSLTPFSQLEIIPNCGHNIHVENLTGWVNAITAFLHES